MSPLFAQSRFPAPEFENYTLPEMNLETAVSDPTYLRVAALVVFLLISGMCFYRVRSRKLLLAVSALGLVVFGYVFTACPCPVGMFQNIAESAMPGSPIPLSVLLLFAVPLAAALFFGRLFCTGACPLGAVQELLYWGAPHVPRPLDRVLRMVPIALLLVLTVMATSGMGFTLCYYDPYLPLFLLSFTLPYSAITLVFLLIGLVVSRPFCRYICPYGVLLRFFALFAAVKPQIPVASGQWPVSSEDEEGKVAGDERRETSHWPLATSHSCINCKLCEQGCPNGAIIPPEPLPPPEIQKHGARWLATLVSLTPFALLLGGIIGYVAAPVVSAWHPDVRLLRMLDADATSATTGEQTLEVEAFYELGKSRTALESSVIHAQNRIMLGMTLCGLIFAGCVMAELIAESRRRKEEDKYTIDASLCFCCGRCYQTCPLEVSGNKELEVRSELRHLVITSGMHHQTK